MANPTQTSGERVNTNVMVSSQARQFVLLTPKLTFRLCHLSSINYKICNSFLPHSVFNHTNDSIFPDLYCNVRLCQEPFMLSIGYWPTASGLRTLRIKGSLRTCFEKTKIN